MILSEAKIFILIDTVSENEINERNSNTSYPVHYYILRPNNYYKQNESALF